MEALERGVLVPLQIDAVKLPLVFRSLQTPQLTDWPTSRSAEALGQTDAIAKPIGTHELLQTKSVAVLPFRSLSPDPDDAFFAEGLADEILTALSRITDLLVASRTSSFLFREGVGGDSKSIGAQLNVNYLLEGSVRKAGNRTIDTQAYREYLLAMHYDRHMHQGGTEELEKVRQHAEQAVALDPQFVPAWILLADVYLNRMGYRMPLQEAHGLARQALTHAMNLDPDNPAVILQLAELTRGDHQYTEALALYKKVKLLDPKSPQVDYATLLFTVGDLDPALAEFERCIDKDPENFSLWYYYAATLLSRGNMPQALVNFHKSLAIAGDGFLADGVRATLAGITFLYEDADQGRELLKPCLEYNPNRIDFEKGLIAGMQGMMGDKAAAQVVATELETRAADEHIDPQALFWAYYGLDEPHAERLFYWLEKMIDEDAFPSIYFLKTWPQLTELRKDRRYQELLTKAGIASVAT